MSLRPCLEPGCPTLSESPRCPTHTREKDQARGTRQERGYDAAYDRIRRNYQLRMEAGEVFICWRCAELEQPHPIDPDAWDLGHDPVDRTVIRGPQCPQTNRATAISWDA